MCGQGQKTVTVLVNVQPLNDRCFYFSGFNFTVGIYVSHYVVYFLYYFEKQYEYMYSYDAFE